MPRFGTFKYGTQARYGRYDLTGSSEFMIQMQNVPFRLKTINNKGEYSLPIIQTNVDIHMPKKSVVRLRTNTGKYVYANQMSVNGNPSKVRIKSISDKGIESPWVECSIGRIMPAKKKTMKLEDMSPAKAAISDEMTSWYERSSIVQKEIDAGVPIADLNNYKVESDISYRDNAPKIDDLSSMRFEDLLPLGMGNPGMIIDKLEKYLIYELKDIMIQDIIKYEMGAERFE